MSRSLLVFPDVGAQPLLDAIAAAQETLRLKMFVFDEPQLLDAIVAAKNRGIDARVMLNPRAAAAKRRTRNRVESSSRPACRCSTATPHSTSRTRSRSWSTTTRRM
jgi:phosphatidylserine/phosphatidylglycerophosphate/cardiolipin synthase-like enzyme